MSNAKRKARKRARQKFSKAKKIPTRPFGKPATFGFVSKEEIWAAMLTRPFVGIDRQIPKRGSKT